MAGEDDLLDMRSLVERYDVFLVVGVRTETRGFRDDDRIAVLGPWMHLDGVALSEPFSAFFAKMPKARGLSATSTTIIIPLTLG